MGLFKTMTDHDHERLDTGIGGVSTDNQDQLARRVRIVPIGEGDVTTGASGERTRWTRDVLKQAVEQGAFDGADIIKGRGGDQAHYPLDEQVPPEAKLGRVDEWTYEDGVGPVGLTELADEQIGERIELGVLDVSADMLRVLADEPDGDGVYEPDEIVKVPRVTVLDRGASQTASIEPATAEALGVPADAVDEYLAREADESAEDGAEDSPADDADGDADPDPASARARLVAAAREIVSLGPPAEDDIDDAPDGMTEAMSGEGSRAAGGDAAADGGESTDDEPAEPGADSVGADGGSDDDDSTHMSDNQTDDIDRLREDLADAESQVADLESEVERLENELAEVPDDFDEQLEAKDDRIDELSTQVAPIRELLAEIVTEGSLMDASTVAEQNDLGELVDMLADEDGDDDVSYTEQVKEQLSQSISPRGDAGGSEDGVEPTEDDLERAEQMAESVMTVRDWRRADDNDLSPREYLAQSRGVDPVECVDETQLRERLAAEGGD